MRGPSLAVALWVGAMWPGAPALAASAPAAQVEARVEAAPPPPGDEAMPPATREAATTPPLNAVASTGYALQPPGQFHGGEAVARDGERWLALRIDRTDAALLPVAVRVATVEDALVDAPGERSGALVSTDPADEAIVMLLRGPALVAGALDEAAVEPPGIGDGPRLDTGLAFRDARYRLRSECAPRNEAPREGQLLFDCRIALRELGGRGREQVLVRMDGYANAPGEPAWLGNDAAPALLFAGDLDRDGELDLLFDTTDHYNVSRPTLFLSSQARPGELLGEVVVYESTGC